PSYICDCAISLSGHTRKSGAALFAGVLSGNNPSRECHLPVNIQSRAGRAKNKRSRLDAATGLQLSKRRPALQAVSEQISDRTSVVLAQLVIEFHAKFIIAGDGPDILNREVASDRKEPQQRRSIVSPF